MCLLAVVELIDTSISLFQKKNQQFFLIILSSFLPVDMDVGNRTILTEFILLGLSTDPQWQLILFGIFLTVFGYLVREHDPGYLNPY